MLLPLSICFTSEFVCALSWCLLSPLGASVGGDHRVVRPLELIKQRPAQMCVILLLFKSVNIYIDYCIVISKVCCISAGHADNLTLPICQNFKIMYFWSVVKQELMRRLM